MKKNPTVKSIHYYDLDGTLSELNSTFDFITMYLKNRRKYFRLYIAKSIMVSLMLSKNYHPYKSRSLMITMLFKGLKKSDLESFFEEHYKEQFLKSLTPLGREVLIQDNSGNVMITGCTEIPALLIGDIFNFSKTISTTFHYKKDILKGIKNDTYGNLKLNFIKKTSSKTIYYTDDLESERDLIEYMDEIIEV